MVWNMWNKILSVILALMLILTPVMAMANESVTPPAGKITGLQAGEKAPYSGVLLNSAAAAKLLAEKNYTAEQWKLKLEYELAKQSTQLNLTIESQKISYVALEKKHMTLMRIKDQELKRLSQIVSNKNDYSIWWASGGIIVGIGLTIAVVYAVHAGPK